MSDEQPLFKIKLLQNPLSIEEQLVERAFEGKCVMGWWDNKGQFITWMPENVSYYEKLFIIDALQRRMDWELQQPPRQGE